MSARVPELCEGSGNEVLPFNFFENWEGGDLPAGWTLRTRNVANKATFEAGWAVSANLPTGANENFAALGANGSSESCGANDTSAVLQLRSPEIVVNADESFVAFDHWFETVFAQDGGNIKISVNGSQDELIPAENFVLNPPNLALNRSGELNPMAGEVTFSGSSGGGNPGIWAQTRVSLAGLARHGDTVQFVFELRTNGCKENTRWYIDDLIVYSCDDLQGPVCGNSVLDPGEQCDDGNGMGGDGCSATCQVEPGFQCTDPVPANTDNLVQDPGFETGAHPMGGGIWDEFSFNFDTPICDETECGIAGQRSGAFWVWFGGISGVDEEGYVAQTITLPGTVTDALFWLKVPACDIADDYVELLVDDNQVWSLFGDDPACGGADYEQITVDISAFADGGMHEIKFHSETFIGNQGFSDFFVDDVEILHGPLTPIPSDCQMIGGFIFGSGFETP